MQINTTEQEEIYQIKQKEFKKIKKQRNPHTKIDL